MSSRARRRLLALAAALAVLVTLCGLAFERTLAWAIVDAPNRGRQVSAGDAIAVPVGPPGATLAVRVLDAPSPRGTVFVLHGVRDRKEHLAGWGEHLVAAGYRAVLVDSRGHGASTGAWLTYGVQEARDLSQVLDTLEARGLVDGPVGAMGVSYGAATAIEWAGREPRVRAVVAVAPFASLREVVPEYVERELPLLHRLLPDALVARAIERAGELGGFAPDDASPRDAIARTRAAVLLVHGRADRHIPARHSEWLHAAAPGSTLVLVDDEDHFSISADRSGVLWRTTLELLSRHLGP
jgi:pimeloyl-ACP methyl ester carboxylesterase